MTKPKITAKAKVLNYHYRNTFFHSIKDLTNDLQFGKWWEELDNFNRAYVLKGFTKKRKKHE